VIADRRSSEKCPTTTSTWSGRDVDDRGARRVGRQLTPEWR
jgi:hypothetical protein